MDIFLKEVPKRYQRIVDYLCKINPRYLTKFCDWEHEETCCDTKANCKLYGLKECDNDYIPKCTVITYIKFIGEDPKRLGF
jgi:hypothetical protein